MMSHSLCLRCYPSPSVLCLPSRAGPRVHVTCAAEELIYVGELWIYYNQTRAVIVGTVERQRKTVLVSFCFVSVHLSEVQMICNLKRLFLSMESGGSQVI